MTEKKKKSERQPPYSEEAEKGVIGSALLEPARVLDLLIEAKVTDKDFFSPAHQRIFLAIGELYGRGKIIDTLTVAEKIGAENLDQIGGSTYLDRLIDSTPTAYHAEDYIEILKQKSLSRMIIGVSKDIEGRAYKSDDPEELRSKAEAAFTRLQIDAPKVSLQQGMARIIDDLVRIDDGGDPRPLGPSTGYPGLDKALGGGMGAGVNFITGQPGTGKTSLACNIILNMIANGTKAAFVTLEMPVDDMLQKMISIITDKNIRHALVGSGLPNMLKVKEAEEILCNSGCFDIADQSAIQDETQFRSWCRRKVLKDGFNVIFLDYLQLLELQDKKVRGEEQVSELTGVVKNVTSSLGVPIVCIGEENKDGGIRYSDRGNYAGATHWRLLKTGDAEPRAPFYKQDFDVFTKKARFGVPSSTTPMVLHGATGRVEELERKEDDYDYRDGIEELPEAEPEGGQGFDLFGGGDTID